MLMGQTIPSRNSPPPQKQPNVVPDDVVPPQEQPDAAATKSKAPPPQGQPTTVVPNSNAEDEEGNAGIVFPETDNMTRKQMTEEIYNVHKIQDFPIKVLAKMILLDRFACQEPSKLQ